MKRYIKSDLDAQISCKFNIVCEIEFPEGIELIDRSIAASTYKGFDIPEGPLLPADKDAAIDTQALDDYHSFVESVEGLLTQYYGLELYYKNDSEYNSFYYGMLAKNADGSILFDFDFTLRVSTHPAKRSKESQKAKKEQEAQLKQITNGDLTRPLRLSVVVNDKRFKDYMSAYLFIDKQVQSKIAIMKRRC